MTTRILLCLPWFLMIVVPIMLLHHSSAKAERARREQSEARFAAAEQKRIAAERKQAEARAKAARREQARAEREAAAAQREQARAEKEAARIEAARQRAEYAERELAAKREAARLARLIEKAGAVDDGEGETREEHSEPPEIAQDEPQAPVTPQEEPVEVAQDEPQARFTQGLKASAEQTEPASAAEQDAGETSACRLAEALGVKGNNAFKGHVVAFTGKLPGMTRREAIQAVYDNGGRAYTKMPVGTTLLVVGEKPGMCKMDKADEWIGQVRKITAQQFFDMLNEPLTVEIDDLMAVLAAGNAA